jgi:hypothetical protein
LDEGDEVYLSTPENFETFKLTGVDLIQVIKEQEAKRKEDALQKEREREQNSLKRGGGRGAGRPAGNRPRGGGVPN